MTTQEDAQIIELLATEVFQTSRVSGGSFTAIHKGLQDAYALGLAAGGGAAREQIAQWVEIGEAVTAFLDCIEWTEHSTEDDACNLKHRIDVALLAVPAPPSEEPR